MNGYYMKNPNNLTLIVGRWYICDQFNVGSRKHTPIVLMYTDDYDEAYYVTHKFGDDSNVRVTSRVHIFTSDVEHITNSAVDSFNDVFGLTSDSIRSQEYDILESYLQEMNGIMNSEVT